jgi:hypothetical protein
MPSYNKAMSKLPTSGPISFVDIAKTFNISTSSPVSLASLTGLSQRLPGGGHLGIANFRGESPLGTQSNPAKSPQDIIDHTGTTQNGEYWIDISGTPTKVYCLMDPAYDGGGWMMLMKAARGNTFGFNANYWTTNNTLNSTSTNRDISDAKFEPFNSVPIRDVMAIFPVQDVSQNGGSLTVDDGWVWQVNNWFNNGQGTTALNGFQVSRDAVPADPFNFSGFSTTSPIWSYQTGTRCHVFGGGTHITGIGSTNRVRWGFLWNNEVGTLSSSDAQAGIGGQVFGNPNYPTATPYSAGDRFSYSGVNKYGYNRTMAVEVYGRPVSLFVYQPPSLATIYNRYELSYSSIATITLKPGVTVSVTGLTGSGMSATSGIISGTPNDVSSNTTYTLTATASDTSGNSEIRTFTLTVRYGRTLLDELPGATKSSCLVAYSLRLVNQSYTGPVVRVRRGSDNQELDFYADPSGNELGTQYLGRGTALSSWLGSNTGYVRTWYDQSTNGNHATQTTAVNQPMILVDTSFNKYTLAFYSTSNISFFAMTTTLTTVSTMQLSLNSQKTGYQYVVGNTSDQTLRLLSGIIYGDNLSTPNRYFSDFLKPSNSYWYIDNAKGQRDSSDVVPLGLVAGSSTTIPLNAWSHVTAIRDRDPISITRIGFSSYSDRSFQGRMNEVVMFSAKLTDANNATLYNIRYHL